MTKLAGKSGKIGNVRLPSLKDKLNEQEEKEKLDKVLEEKKVKKGRGK